MNKDDLLQIANDYGSPVYVYDAHKMEAQYKRLTAAFNKVKQLKINYAVKALSNISILKFMNKLGAGLDTVSIQEVQLGLVAGYKPEAIIFTPNETPIFPIFPFRGWVIAKSILVWVYENSNRPLFGITTREKYSGRIWP